MPSVLSVASEAYPLIKTGGLADVAGALPAMADGLRLAIPMAEAHVFDAESGLRLDAAG